jgi:hypothetical protein
MKPSERIGELYIETMDRHWAMCLQSDPDAALADAPAVIRWRQNTHALHLATALVDYLDEQHGERKRLDRRAALFAALNPQAGVKQANHLLEQAGLNYRVFLGASIPDVFKGVLDEAKEKGLL